MKHAVSVIDGITDERKLPSKRFAVDILVAMRQMSEAWDEFPQSSIRNCWMHTGIVERDVVVEHPAAITVSRLSLDFLLNSIDGCEY